MNTIYRDKLIELTDEGVTFHRYYFPFGDRSVSFSEMERIEVRPASITDGSWRLWGTGDFRTWFPLDASRPARDRIFTVILRNARRRIGFTVEHPAEVEGVLKERGLLYRR